MKRVYNIPVTEVILMNACSVLCASGDPVSSAPSLTVPGSEDKGKPAAAF